MKLQRFFHFQETLNYFPNKEKFVSFSVMESVYLTFYKAKIFGTQVVTGKFKII